ncbi:succinyl-CoA synthetase, beta subunit [Candidatus Methanoperedens nitroreducens]|uniref:Succinate--CoA ligase [ADP-forming] subunit beta n=1 Tax=Candidatus Methanoperedens nitratireducens TaxID=1392998 RepID=A0A062VDE2_9EURY|nr:ADP-forming succinate--CoA ligase subunit beta [Candidatus Methanoperedens nitroreducens]KCZ73684.1 succinyl-CoA synthetase, beta subunit [Candidatus Methanoperedens nitroreducens]MDJ1422357.1 ADP-forming succinate--CoA ligase subunit beta [Candidatus Methanoperedens sp.]
MMLYEYAAKEIFSRCGIPVPGSSLITSADDAGAVARKLGSVVIKAQVTAGGRGKAGGILTAATPDEAAQKAQRILGMSIKGLPVKKVLVEEYKKPEKEMYLGITIDRKARRPIIMASTEGGIDIEETARNFPEKIFRIHIDPLTGIHDYQARRIAYSLDRENSTLITDLVKKLYRVFTDYDCTLAEINPLAQASGAIFALDAKMVIDDNALFRQDVGEEEDVDALSGIAKKQGMSYVSLDGDIGCIVNGAGLAMATLDMIRYYGGQPANFMDVRAGANAEQVKTALRIVSSNRNVKAIIMNIFGGITKCDEVARGIIDVISEVKVPLVIRLTGTNEESGRRMLEEHGIDLASSTEEAAEAVVELGHSHR